MGKYKRKTDRQGWSRESMTEAVAEVKRGAAVYATAKKYNLPEATLRRYAKKYIEENFPPNAGRFRSTFTDEQLLRLKQYVEEIDKRAFGLTREQFSKIAFNYCEALKIPHRFNNEKKRVGKDFIQSFMSKFNFSLRKPEATSAARLAAFNKTNVESFFNLYKEILTEKKYEPHQIFNIDETGCSTVPTKTPNVLSPTGNRRVIKISSAERGVNVSVACAFNAVGQFVPPFFIFPRVRMQSHFLNNAPPGSSGSCNETGWMNAETFVLWLRHFIKNARPSKENRILLLMDNHSSHTTLEAVNLCRENHITLLGFPPHTSHRMQPLDVAFYGPFKTAYSKACDDYLVEHPGKTISIKDVAALFHIAYNKVATVDHAVQGFKATGLIPLNSQIFNDSDFEPSMTTEKPYRPRHDAREVNDEGNEEPVADENEQAVDKNEDLTAVENLEPTPGPSHADPYFGLPPIDLHNTALKERKQRKKLLSLQITSTPVKKALEEKQAEKEAKKHKKEENQRKRNEKRMDKEMKNAKKGTKKGVRELFTEYSSDSSVSVQYADDDDEDSDIVGEELCMLCNEYGKSEMWYACAVCRKWAHAACSGLSPTEAKLKAYVCDFCV